MQWFVDAEDLLKAIGEEYGKQEHAYVKFGLCLAMYCVKCATNPLEAQDIIQMSWISVKDRLPDPGELYLVWSTYSGVEIFHYDYIYGGKKPCFYKDDENGYPINEDDWVTHWMPLPKSPSEQ